MQGDPAAFGALFARHRDRLWAVALRTTGNPEDAADALQDAMVSAFRRAESFRGDAQVTTWLHRIVVNACLDRIRRATRSGPPSRCPTTSTSAPPAATSSSPPAEARPRRRRRAVRASARAVLAALAQLPPEQRAALVLVDMQGYPVDEAAAILECAARHGEEPLLARAGPGWRPLLGRPAIAAEPSAASPRVPSRASTTRPTAAPRRCT